MWDSFHTQILTSIPPAITFMTLDGIKHNDKKTISNDNNASAAT